MDQLRFHLLGFPVAVLPSALVLAGIFLLFELSGAVTRLTLLSGASFVAFAFVGILLHELGHALMARRFGLEPIEITLHGYGGLTRHAGSDSPGQAFLISLAGPVVGLVLGGGVWLAARSLGPLGTIPELLVWNWVFVNFWWAVLNLLPMYPLDGGQALGAALSMVVPRVAWTITFAVGLALGAAAVVFGLVANEVFALLIGGMFGWQNWQMLQRLRTRRER